MKIRFLKRHRVDMGEGQRFYYDEGSVHDFPGPVGLTYARKYVERGYAEEVVEAKPEDLPKIDRKGRGRHKSTDGVDAADGAETQLVNPTS